VIFRRPIEQPPVVTVEGVFGGNVLAAEWRLVDAGWRLHGDAREQLVKARGCLEVVAVWLAGEHMDAWREGNPSA
jgi:hypothetical protein